MNDYGIGELARRSGVKIANIRFYEQEGLLPKPGRRASGHRSYDDSDLGRLRFVKNCRDLGYTLDQIRELLRLSKTQGLSCGEVRDLVAEQLEIVRQRQRDLKALEVALSQHIRECDRTCKDAPAPDCSIFKSLIGAPCC